MSGEWTGTSTPYLGSGQGDVWKQEAAAQGRKGSQRIVFAGETPASAETAGALGVPVDTMVVARQRLILSDDEPVELAVSYWPLAVAGGTLLARPGKIRGGAVTFLAECGYTPTSVEEQVYTRPATAEERDVLHLEPSEWVLVLVRSISGDDGRPYEAAVNVSPGRVGRLNYSMKVA